MMCKVNICLLRLGISASINFSSFPKSGVRHSQCVNVRASSELDLQLWLEKNMKTHGKSTTHSHKEKGNGILEDAPLSDLG